MNRFEVYPMRVSAARAKPDARHHDSRGRELQR
jgi:hypothetical protein